jgi:hypothetical protein
MFKRENKELDYYFTISRFFQRRFLPLHFLHLSAVSALRAPQSLQIFMYKRCFCAMLFFTGSNIGIVLCTFRFGLLLVTYQIYLLSRLGCIRLLDTLFDYFDSYV